jgi:enoyl-CoA hydratase/carnithine racemase
VSILTAGQQPGFDDHRITSILVASPDDCQVSLDEIGALTSQITTAAARQDRVVILSSGQTDFCRGRRAMGDVTADQDYAQRLAMVRAMRDLRAAIRTAPMPVLAAVRGQARGLGWAIAASCDLIIASRTARFSLPELGDGFAPLIALSAVLDSARQAVIYAVLSGQELEPHDDLGWRPAVATYTDDELNHQVLELAKLVAGMPTDAGRAVLTFLRATSDPNGRDARAVDMFSEFISGRFQPIAPK